jgi:hypothetical protein
MNPSSRPPLTPEQEAASTASPERLQELIRQYRSARMLRKAACNRAIARRIRFRIIPKRCLANFLASVERWHLVTFFATNFYEEDDGNYTDDSKSPYTRSESVHVSYYQFELERIESEEEIYQKLNNRLGGHSCDSKLYPNLNDMSCEFTGHQNTKQVTTFSESLLCAFILLMVSLGLFWSGNLLVSNIKYLFDSFYNFFMLLMPFGVAFVAWIVLFGLASASIRGLYKRLVIPSISLFPEFVAMLFDLPRLILLIMVN